MKRRYPDTGGGGEIVRADRRLCILCDKPYKKNYKETKLVSEENFSAFREIVSESEKGRLKCNESVYHQYCFKERKRNFKRSKLIEPVQASPVADTLSTGVIAQIRLLTTNGPVPLKVLAGQVGYDGRVDYLKRIIEAEIDDVNIASASAPHPCLVYSATCNTYELLQRNLRLTQKTTILEAQLESQKLNSLTVDAAVKRIADHCRSTGNARRADFQAFGKEFDVSDPVFDLVDSILSGNTSNDNRTQACKSISDLIYFNMSSKNQSIESGRYPRHNKNRETSTPLYVAWKIYCAFRSKEMIDKFHSLGLCISYDRLMQIMNNCYHAEINRFELETVVCPSGLNRACFTTGSFDNIDHKTTSITARTEFHGTSICLTTHGTVENQGLPRMIVPYVETNDRKLKPLPESFKTVAGFKPDTRGLLATCSPSVEALEQSAEIDDNRDRWLGCAKTVIATGNFSDKISLSRSAYTSTNAHETSIVAAQTCAFPLFRNKAATISMSLHAMKTIAEATEYLHPGQIPVVTVDCPLYALCKMIQWIPNTPYNEANFFVKFGDLHVEHIFQQMLGQLLDGTGLCELLAVSGIYEIGRAESVMHATHITRTRYIHQVNAIALFVLRDEAYSSSTTTLPFDQWCNEKIKSDPQFGFHETVLNLELLLLDFVWSIRKGDFRAYLRSLHRISALCFSFDRIHYARWLTVHVRDLMQLENMNGYLYQKFEEGFFAASCSNTSHSKVGLDQAHEMQNAVLKRCGGIIGLTEDEVKLDKLLVAAPAVAQMVSSFELEVFGTEEGMDTIHPHHEACSSFQNQMLKDVRALLQTYRENGSPFVTTSAQLTVLDTGVILPPEIWLAVSSIETLGESQRNLYISERLLENRRKSILERITLNKLLLPSRYKSMRALPRIVNLSLPTDKMMKFYAAASGVRADALKQFFTRELGKFPPSLVAPDGGFRDGRKSTLMAHLENGQPIKSCRDFTCKVIDGASLIRALNPEGGTFEIYRDQVFIPYVQQQLESLERVDVVWDRYFLDSMKLITRDRRGIGTRRTLKGNRKLPTNWSEYLKNSDNKTQLFEFLAIAISELSPNRKELYTTVKSETIPESSKVASCNHEEFDTRCFLHVNDAVESGHTRVCIQANDTDILVIALSAFHELSKKGLEKLYLRCGWSSDARYIPVHTLAHQHSAEFCAALPYVHALSGSDVTSFVLGVGKCRAVAVAEQNTDLVRALASLPKSEVVPQETICLVEQYFISLYCPKSSFETMDQAREHLYLTTERGLKKLPPTQDALILHIKRSILQGHIWSCCLSPNIPNLDRSQLGWKIVDDKWLPQWTSLGDVTTLQALTTKCKHHGKCPKTCKCHKFGGCTNLCK